ncbi:ABC transporter ATP-binding protein [Haloglomus salinum]|jgi:iron(III) transport system ATP-binding protein|uniref:ABC transporter ATP-binding protein n=1 Tax=Haloglomus salinum TaxID=2962673 RepID=UPI0020C94A92|nr:ABC transporter ATP-binding protein [Haloglomus salinum]
MARQDPKTTNAGTDARDAVEQQLDRTRADPALDGDVGWTVDGNGDGDTVLELDGVTKQFGATTAVDGVSMTVSEGELLTLLGPSGCGKTTTLRLLAGLERPDEGVIRLNGEPVAVGAEGGEAAAETEDVDDGGFLPPEERDVGLVFQDFALFPHLTVAENVAFGLEGEADENAERVADLLDLVDLPGYEDRRPDELSGGERQRVALARSLAPEPAVLLLDEPFSNLDVRLRVAMREEVRDILKQAGVTAVSVTHDQEEALSISDRVAVMNGGHVAQIGSPESLFQHPESRFVASFLGQASFLDAEVRPDCIETGLGCVDNDDLAGPIDAYDGTHIQILVRPDDLRATPVTEDAADGRIVRRQYNGPTFVYRVELDSGDTVHCMHNHVEEFTVGQPVAVELTADHELAWYPP